MVTASWRVASRRWMSCAVFAAVLWLVSGDAKDISGSSDHPALSRIAGSTIVVYERKDQAEIRIPLERVIFDLQTQKFNAFKTISASGRLTRILYALPAGSTPQDGITKTRCAKPMARCSFLVRRISSTMAMTGLLIRFTTATSKIGYTTFFS